MTMPKMDVKVGITFQHKTISIRSDQNEFLQKNSISLSRFVQQKIDELMSGNKARK